MGSTTARIAVIAGDGIGPDVTEGALAVAEAAVAAVGGAALSRQPIAAGAAHYRATGQDIEAGGETAAGRADAIFLGAIGLPHVRRPDGTEISPHLRLRERYGLYAGVRPVRAYAHAPQRLADPRAAEIDLVILRESTEGLFYSAAVHGRSRVEGDAAVYETLRISREVTERLHRFGFRLAEKRRARGRPGRITCVDKANVFNAMAFFRKIFDEVAQAHPAVAAGHNYVDAQALDLIRMPWAFDVLVTENMFGDILSDLAAGLVGGMGMAPCGEIGESIGLFQPAHGSAPDIAGQDRANPCAAILSGALMLDDLSDRLGIAAFATAGRLVDAAVARGFEARRLRPMEFGGDMGTRAMVRAMLDLVAEPSTRNGLDA